MKKTLMTGTAAALALAVAACGSNQDATQNQQNMAASDMDTMMADPNNPFATAMMQMMERMTAAVGSNVGQNWARKMIVHHQGAIDMSRIVLEQNPTPDVARLAQETIDDQTREIAEIQELVEEGPPDQQSAALYQPAMMEMHQKMMAASGGTISETYLRKMAEHHEGAVAMSDIALANGVSGPMRNQVQQTRAAQLREIEMIQAMLSGEAPPSAAAASGSAAPPASGPVAPAARESAPPPSAATTATPRSAPSRPAPTQPADPAPEPVDPHAGHDMNNMQH